MFLDSLPLVFILAGAILYVVLSGADFGAGVWRLFPGRGEQGEQIREHANHSMGPVWEANHVWLIFVITVCWTAYPRMLGSLASTLALPLFVAGLGIVVRGAAYALRSTATNTREIRRVDTAFGVVSLIAPFMLGTAAGALAAERVPVGNAAGGLISSWTGPVSILIGLLSVGFSTYISAVFLAADAVRRDHPELVAPMKRRALITGMVAGLLAAIGLVVIEADAHGLYESLIHGGGVIALIISALIGMATLLLVWREHFEAARYGAALAVAAVVAGWAVARWPVLLPGLTIRQAAASHDTMVCLIVAVLAGGALLFPSLALLFSLTLGGRLGGGFSLDDDADAAPSREPVRLLQVKPSAGRLALVLLIAGVGLLNAADAGWCHALGVLSLLGFGLVGFGAIIAAAFGPGADPESTAS